MTETLKVSVTDPKLDANCIKVLLGNNEEWMRTKIFDDVLPTSEKNVFEIIVPDSVALIFLKSVLQNETGIFLTAE